MSKKNRDLNNNEPVEVMEDTVEEVTEAVEEPVHKLTEDEVEVLHDKEMHVSCNLLNIRKAPVVKDNIVMIVPERTLVVIDESYENKEWAKVVAVPEKKVGRVTWYCMKKFLA